MKYIGKDGENIRKMAWPGLMALLVMACCVYPQIAAAHGTDYRLLKEESMMGAKFFYDDGEPMSYAETLVFSPENDQIEHQNGRTDQNGRFAFCPHQPGVWHIKVNDGMGHAVLAEVEVASAISGKPAATAAPADTKASFADTSRIFRTLFGLSVLMNIFFGLYLWTSKFRRR